VNPLGLPRALTGLIGDIQTIARTVGYLPELARILASIERRVETLDQEVRLMREKVDEIGDDVILMRDSVGPIGRLAERLPRRRRAAVSDSEDVAPPGAELG
jgi:hypothetical protein